MQPQTNGSQCKAHPLLASGIRTSAELALPLCPMKRADGRAVCSSFPAKATLLTLVPGLWWVRQPAANARGGACVELELLLPFFYPV